MISPVEMARASNKARAILDNEVNKARQAVVEANDVLISKTRLYELAIRARDQWSEFNAPPLGGK